MADEAGVDNGKALTDIGVLALGSHGVDEGGDHHGQVVMMPASRLYTGFPGRGRRDLQRTEFLY